jgi:Tfp pilus assembly protein PilE
MIKRKQQRGITMIGMLFVGIIIVFVALVAMKLIPAYTEFLTIQKILKDIGSEAGAKSMSNANIRERFEKRAGVDNITTVKPADLTISRESGQTVVSVEYSFQTPLVANVSLLVDFSASSDGRESKIAQQLE